MLPNTCSCGVWQLMIVMMIILMTHDDGDDIANGQDSFDDDGW